MIMHTRVKDIVFRAAVSMRLTNHNPSLPPPPTTPYLEEYGLNLSTELTFADLLGGVHEEVGGDPAGRHPLLTTQHPDDDVRDRVLGLGRRVEEKDHMEAMMVPIQ